MSHESGDGGQHASPPGLLSPGQPHQRLPSDRPPFPVALTYAHVESGPYTDAVADAEASYRATRSSLPSQDKIKIEYNVDVTKVPASLSFDDEHSEHTWKDEWVISLIHLRGSLDDEFIKPQKSCLDLWTRVCAGMADAHDDFDMSSESCRKKWQVVYKMFKDAKVAMTSITEEEMQLPSRWFELIDHYMQHHFDANGSAIGSDEPIILDESSNIDAAVDNDIIVHHIQVNAKRARRDQEIKETLAKMVVTWRESLEILKDSEAKRLQILQKMSTTMAGLLDALKK